MGFFQIQVPFKNDLDNRSQSSFATVKGAARSYKDVWYRRFLKPLSKKDSRVSNRDVFRRRAFHSSGIPVAELEGFHKFFEPSYRRYSPLYGLLFSYNNMVDNLYRYGNADAEPAVALIRSLFHQLPGGDVQPTHLGSEPGAHLSASLIGLLIEKFESLKHRLEEMPHQEAMAFLVNELLQQTVNHPDYQLERKELIENSVKAQQNLNHLRRRDEESQPVRDEIKMLEGDVIKASRHKVKRLKKQLDKFKDKQAIEKTISEIEITMKSAERKVADLRSQIVTSLDFKLARKNLQRAEQMVEQEKSGREAYVTALASSFLRYDLESANPSCLPKYTTAAVLLAYMWRKYDGVHFLEEYFEVMERMGALVRPAGERGDLLKQEIDCTLDSSIRKFPRVQEWSAGDTEAAAIVVIGQPGVIRRPTIVPFSYITWAAYSEFPDCGETALRNFLNQLLYNPNTGMFDHGLLKLLRAAYYPNMNPKLLQFYQRHVSPQDSTSQETAVEWIDTTTGLNDGRDGGVLIRYRREKQQTNIASPLKNLLRVFNALFGIEPLDKESLPEVIDHMNELRDTRLRVDMARVRDDGFGVVSLSDGKVRYELQSYKPVHFGFVQAETLRSDAAGKQVYGIFRKLKKYSCGIPHVAFDKQAYFEQLALASLFVPYQLNSGRIKPFFRVAPAHYMLLFADMTGPAQRLAAVEWAKGRESNVQLEAFIKGIESYQEPDFMPRPK
jgi:hypothetical protein